MNKTLKRFSYPYLVWIFIMIVIPFLLIFLYSITSSKSGSPATFKFTFEHYTNFFQGPNLSYLYKSLWVAIQTTLYCLILGYPAAWIISRINIRRQNTILLFFILPMWINMLLRTYAWQVILGENGIISSFYQGILFTDTAVLIGMVYNFIPFMVLPIYTSLIKIDEKLIEAAQDLGASTKETFTKVIFPLSIPGVVTGVILVFLPAVSSFAIPKLLGGGQYLLIGNLIEKQFYYLGNWNYGSAISVILMILILLSMMFMKKTDDIKTSGGGTLPW